VYLITDVGTVVVNLFKGDISTGEDTSSGINLDKKIKDKKEVLVFDKFENKKRDLSNKENENDKSVVLPCGTVLQA